MSAIKIYTDGNDYEFEYEVDLRDEDTGLGEGAAGLSLTGRLSLTRGGVTIHADLDVNAVPRTADPKLYYGRFPGAALKTHCASLARAFLVFGNGQNITVSDPVEFISSRES